MKRLTDTEKWNDPWFRRLSPELKCFWFFVLDNCDHSGVWKVDMELANFVVGGNLTEETVLDAMPGRFKKLDSEKWFVAKFIAFQYGAVLNPSNTAHLGVLRRLEACGIEAPIKVLRKGLPRGFQAPKDKDKDKDKDKNREGESERKPLLLRVRRLFGKRDSTPMDASEQRAWKAAEKSVADTSEPDWQLIEWVYRQSNGSACQFRRKDMATLLNNWNCEIDRAKGWKNGNGKIEKNHGQFVPVAKRETRQPSESELEAQRKIVRESSAKLREQMKMP